MQGLSGDDAASHHQRLRAILQRDFPNDRPMSGLQPKLTSFIHAGFLPGLLEQDHVKFIAHQAAQALCQ